MLVFLLTIFLCWLPTLGTAAVLDSRNVALRTRNGPGMTDADTVNAVKRALHVARLQSHDHVYRMNKTTFAKSLNDATLFPYELTLICRRHVTHKLAVPWALLESPALLATSKARPWAT
jgi:hypothetical protein